MISKNISSRIVSIGPSLKGKGGIAILISSLATMFDPFYFIVSLQGNTKIRKLFVLIMAEFELIYYCLFKGINIVHIHTGSGIDFFRNAIFVCTAKIFGKKIIIHIHGGDFEAFYRRHPILVRYVCLKANMLITVSKPFVELLYSNHLNERISLLHNLISPPVLTPKKRINERIVFLFIGRIDETKGIFDVLECIAENKSYFEDKITLEIGGTGDVERMHNLIINNGLETFVHFCGWVSGEQKQQCFSQADIFIHPSYIESFGIAILEAMSYGLPIITTSIGGIPDLVQNGENGITVEPGNKEQIRNAMQRLLEDVILREQLGLVSSEKAINFYPDKIEQKLHDIYVELL